MPTNLAINDALLERAVRLGNLKTKRETVNLALKEFIERRRQKMILALEGKITFKGEWDYKKDRRGRESGS